MILCFAITIQQKQKKVISGRPLQKPTSLDQTNIMRKLINIFINTFVSQIKYSLTSLQPCVNFKEDNKLIRELIIALFNIKDADINEKEEEMISRCMAYLESNKVLKTPIKYNIKNPQSYHHANFQK